MDEQNSKRNFDLSSFTRARDKMIATNESAYHSIRQRAHERLLGRMTQYTPEAVADIIETGSLEEQQALSRYYFQKDGYYKQILMYYATLLRYMGLLIPNPSAGKNLSSPHIAKRYYSAMDFVEAMHLPVWMTNCAQRALVDGCYYGVRIDADKNTFTVLDLPAKYCCSRFKDAYGNDLIEFNLSYFDTILLPESKDAALEAFPKVIAKAYRKWKKGNLSSNWFLIPSEIGICIPFFDGRPVFLSVIPATLGYDEAVSNRQEKEAEDIRKIIVQKIPHTTDGRLVFEPDEAEEIHAGTVGMLKGNSNVSILTTYADVDAITSNASDDNSDDLLTRIERNIYTQAGVSGEIFAATGSASLDTSIKNDIAFMMYFANKAATYVTNVINDKWSNSNIHFKFSFMDVSYFNESEFIGNSFKLVGSGYSALMPALAFGLSQKDLVGIKDLENDVLKLNEKLKPLSTSYTQSSSDQKSDKNSENQSEEDAAKQAIDTDPDVGGRPPLQEGEKTEKTVANEESKNKTGGGW